MAALEAKVHVDSHDCVGRFACGNSNGVQGLGLVGDVVYAYGDP